MQNGEVNVEKEINKWRREATECLTSDWGKENLVVQCLKTQFLCLSTRHNSSYSCLFFFTDTQRSPAGLRLSFTYDLNWKRRISSLAESFCEVRRSELTLPVFSHLPTANSAQGPVNLILMDYSYHVHTCSTHTVLIDIVKLSSDFSLFFIVTVLHFLLSSTANSMLTTLLILLIAFLSSSHRLASQDFSAYLFNTKVNQYSQSFISFSGNSGTP